MEDNKNISAEDKSFFSMNKKFFRKAISIKTMVLLVIVLSILGVVVLKNEVGAFSGALIAIGIIAYLKMSAPTPRAVLDSCLKRTEGFKKEALEELGLDESDVTLAEPMIINGFDYKNRLTDEGISKYEWKGCEIDGESIWFTPSFVTNVLFFTESEVHLCTKSFSLISNATSINTSVYFYKDIVSLSTTSIKESIEISGGKKTKTFSYNACVLANAGGEKYQFSMLNKDISDKINSFRNLLRQKKMEK